MKEAYVALGANLGQRESALREALRRLNATPGIEVCRVSNIYETDPVGYTEQPAFMNMAAVVATDLEPETLLRSLLRIEQEMGRVREIRWGPRTIDLDLLLYEGIAMDTERLTLPHPRMGERAFVLVPLHDIWPGNREFPWKSAITEEARAEAGIKPRGRLDGLVNERSGSDVENRKYPDEQ